MAKYVEVATTQPRFFVEALLILGAVGATLPADAGAFKGAMLRAKVQVPEDVKFEVTNSMRVIEVADAPVAPTPVSKPVPLSTDVVSDKLTREQLEAMSLGEVRKATGIEKGGKEAIIKQYLGEE